MSTLAHKAPQLLHPGAAEAAVLHALLYFEVFRFPLYAHEILEYSKQPGLSKRDVREALERMKSAGMVRQQGELYTVNEDDAVFSRRIEGGIKAAKYLKTARRLSTFISAFPFVRGVMISGSLSKGFMDKKSDIDYFIITEKGRLWISRSLLAAFRKLLPYRLRKYFCINYFIDTSGLKIPEQNLFTATEIAFIHPTYNPELYHEFIAANSWVHQSYFPNKDLSGQTEAHSKNKFFPRVMIEKVLSGRLGDKLEQRLHTFMSKRWEKRFSPGHIREEFELNFRTRANSSKHHPKAHQAKILSQYQSNVEAFETLHGVTLSE